MNRVALPPTGTFLCADGFSKELLASALSAHAQNQQGDRLLKLRFGTVVTRTSIAHDKAAVATFGASEVAVKEVAVPTRRRIAYALGCRSRFHRDFNKKRELTRLGVLTPPILVCSWRAVAGKEYEITEFIEGKTVRQLLWYGETPLSDATDRIDLLTRVGAWVRKLHDQGVWQRDMKAHNVFVGDAPPQELYLLDITAVKFFGEPLAEERRVRNLGQLLDVPAHLDAAVAAPLLAGYFGGEPGAHAWHDPIRRVVESRRQHRLRTDGFRYVDERVLSKN